MEIASPPTFREACSREDSVVLSETTIARNQRPSPRPGSAATPSGGASISSTPRTAAPRMPRSRTTPPKKSLACSGSDSGISRWMYISSPNERRTNHAARLGRRRCDRPRRPLAQGAGSDRTGPPRPPPRYRPGRSSAPEGVRTATWTSAREALGWGATGRVRPSSPRTGSRSPMPRFVAGPGRFRQRSHGRRLASDFPRLPDGPRKMLGNRASSTR